MGTTFLGVLAKSNDGLVQSEDFSPIFVPVGQQVTLVTQVLRPSGLDKQHTDYLSVIVIPYEKKPVLRHKLDWQYVWPEKTANSAGTDQDTPARGYSVYESWTLNLEREDFSALDQLLEKWKSPEQRGMNGEWKLDGFWGVLYRDSGQGRNWKEGLERIQRWRKFNPKSAGAAFAEAAYWTAYAWNIRGSEYNPNTDPVAVRIFGERMKRAEQVLKTSKPYASNNPLWYAIYLGVAVDTRRDIRFVEKLYAEGMHKHPYFEPLHLRMAMYWSPLDGGRTDWQKVDEVIGNAVALTTVTDGISNYARLYKSIHSRQRLEFELFQSSHVSWPKMRDAFDELIKRYPTPENVNEFASYACQAEDKDTYLRLRARIKDRILPDEWRGNYSPDMCDRKFMLYS